jgi:aminoglycoside phosphotransferase (APT) family kinase protein
MDQKADSQGGRDRVEELAQRVATRLGRTVAAAYPVGGGYSAATRILVRWREGGSAFVKAATDADTANWLRAEHAIYSRGRAPFLPELLGWADDGAAPWLAIEDLSGAFWPPPWSPARVEAVLETLRDVAATPASDLPSYEESRELFTGWSLVAADPERFLRLGVATASWLDRALPRFIDAERRAVLDGDALLHNDVRSDNLCFAGRGVVLVDWNWASRGNPKVDLAAWLPSLAMEGGPAPESLLPEEPELASLVAGFYAAHAGLPPPREMRAIREFQLAMLRESLAWASRALDLEMPDGRSSANQSRPGI